MCRGWENRKEYLCRCRNHTLNSSVGFQEGSVMTHIILITSPWFISLSCDAFTSACGDVCVDILGRNIYPFCSNRKQLVNHFPLIVNEFVNFIENKDDFLPLRPTGNFLSQPFDVFRLPVCSPQSTVQFQIALFSDRYVRCPGFRWYLWSCGCRRVNEAEWDAVDVHQIFDAVARSAVCMSDTMAFSSFDKQLAGDLPTLVSPTRATGMPFSVHFPLWTIRQVPRFFLSPCQFAQVCYGRQIPHLLHWNRAQFHQRNKIQQLAAKFLQLRRKPPRIWLSAMRCEAEVVEAIRSATASACERSILPLRKARMVVSGFSHGAAFWINNCKNLLLDILWTVARYLYHIFACKWMRSSEYRYQYFVHRVDFSFTILPYLTVYAGWSVSFHLFSGDEKPNCIF